jgi:hypothetical protein
LPLVCAIIFADLEKSGEKRSKRLKLYIQPPSRRFDIRHLLNGLVDS